MTFNMLRIICCCLLLMVLNNWSLQALPAVATELTTHIVSYVNQRKGLKTPPHTEKKHAEFEDFDFENFRSNRSAENNAEMRGTLQQLYGRFVKNFDTALERLEEVQTPSRNVAATEMSVNRVTSDDLIDGQMNTLENGFGDNEQHESANNENMWHRSKQSIPVLESVRHLVNSVRDGHLNNTEHVQRNRTLLVEMSEMPENTTSQAIETEQEREMANASNDLQFLEVLGSIGSRIWNFLSNIRQVFAASASTASGASSSSSSS